MDNYKLQENTIQCPKAIEVVMRILRVAVVIFAVAGPVCMFLIMSATCREVSPDGSFYTIVFGGSAAMVLISVALVLLTNYVMAGKMWAYYIIITVFGLSLGYLGVGLFFFHMQNWFTLVGFAIFFLLLVIPFIQYRQYAYARRN